MGPTAALQGLFPSTAFMKWSACGKPTAGAAGLPESGPDPLVLGRHAPLRERLDEVTRGFGQSVGEPDLYKIIGQE